MVMPLWLAGILITAGLAVVASFWGWLAVRVVEQGRKLIELDAKIVAQQRLCGERLKWIRDMDAKMHEVAENTAAILAKLED